MRISIHDLARVTGIDEIEMNKAFDEGERQRAYDDDPRPQPRESATILPFPIAKQQRRIESDLTSVRDYEAAAAARYLRSAVRQHRGYLRRIKVSPDRIAADVAELEKAFGLTG